MSFRLVTSSASWEFADLGVTAARLTISNQGKDELDLTLDRDVSQGSPFAPFARVSLYEDGALRFTGWADHAPVSLEGNRQQMSVKLSGPWRWLDMVTYSQPFVPAAGTPSTAKVQVPVIGQGVTSAGVLRKQSLAEVLNEALIQVTARHGGVLTFNSGDLRPLGLRLPWHEKQNTSCGSVIRELLAWVPNYSFWWDYSSPTPSLRITASGSVTRQVSDVGVDLQSLRLDPRFDLLASRVRLTYVTTFTDAATKTDKRDLVVDDTGSAGLLSDAAVLGSPLEIHLSFALQKGEPAPDPGIAAAYLAGVGKLAVETDVTSQQEDLGWGMMPGELWGFAGVASPWARYTSVAQSLARDLMARTVTVRLGHAAHLGIQQLIDLHRKNVPQAALLGGGGGAQASPKAFAPSDTLTGGTEPAVSSSVTVKLAISTGSQADMDMLLGSCSILLSGNGWSGTQGASKGGTTFSGLKAGAYTLSVTSPSGWMIDTTVHSDTQISVADGAVYPATIYLTKYPQGLDPWTVLSQNKQGADGTLQWGVIPYAPLLNSRVPTDLIPLSGCLASNTPSVDDGNWHDVGDNDVIFLEVTFDSGGVATAATIKTQSSGGTLDIGATAWTSGSVLEASGGTSPYQTVARKVIAYVSWVNGARKVFQSMRSGQILLDGNEEGRACRYPHPFDGGVLY